MVKLKYHKATGEEYIVARFEQGSKVVNKAKLEEIKKRAKKKGIPVKYESAKKKK